MKRLLTEDDALETSAQEKNRQRRYPRVRKRRPVVVRRDGHPDPVAFGRLETLSWGGALLHCDRPIPDAAETEITICLAGGVVKARARVLYHLPHEDGDVIGVEFLDLPDDGLDLLDHLVSRRRNGGPGAHTPRRERWPFLLFGPAPPPEKRS